MKLSRQKRSALFILPLIAVFSIGAGFVAGRIMRDNHEHTSAASSNITVDNNDQLISRDQSTGVIVIEQLSIVTVRNTEANYGYTLSAKIGQNTLTGASVTIGSVSSLLCPLDDPCTLTAESQAILETTTNAATEIDGDTNTFSVVITVPAEAGVSDYVLDIEYQEEANEMSGLTEGANIQDLTKAACDVTTIGTIVNLKDTRDGTYYRVKKMPDENCWMVDNLAYDINSAPAQGKPTYNPVAVKDPASSVDTQAQYAQNNNTANQGQIPNNGTPKASYLYNWCAAIGDTSANCTASKNATNLQTVLNGTATTTATAIDQPEVQGICPAPFRLPKGGPESSPASTPSSTANEFAKLDIDMGGLGTNRTSANTYPNFTGTTTDQKDWFGTLSGYYYSSLYNQGSGGYWWSSTAYSTTYAYYLNLYQSSQNVGPANYNYRNRGFAVRCLL